MKSLMKPKGKPTRTSETNTHFLVVSFGKPYKKHEFIKFVEEMKLGIQKEHPKLQEFSFFDINVPRSGEQQFLKKMFEINIAGYFPRKFIKAIQFLLKHIGSGKGYDPFNYDDLLKVPRSRKHKLLSYFPCLIGYRRHDKK